MIAYGCCVGSYDKMRRYVLPRVNEKFFTVDNASSIAEAYNEIIGVARGVHDLEALVLLHDDLEITDGDFETKVRATLAEPNVGVIGVIGSVFAPSLDWWNYGIVGHQLTDTTNINSSVRSGDVGAVDGSLLVLSRWTVDNVQFDTNYDGFHGYDCDITRSVAQHTKRVIVIDADTHHHTTLGWKSGDVFQSWQRANDIYQRKWSL